MRAAVVRRLAVVTGASSGIGAATALALGARGWTVVVVARRHDRLQRLADAIRDAGGEAVVEAIDAADQVAVASMSGRIQVQLGVPDVIVHAAGAGGWQWARDTTPAALEASLDAPLRATHYLTHAFLGGMAERDAGVIVHVGSPAGLFAWPGVTGHTVAAWAVRGLHESLRQEFAGTGVRSCLVVFGRVDTAFWEANPGARDQLPWLLRLGAAFTPEDGARAILAVIDRPCGIAVHPRRLRTLARLSRWMPSVTSWLLRRGPARRPTPTRRPRRR